MHTGASPNAICTVSGRSSVFIACSREMGLRMLWLASALNQDSVPSWRDAEEDRAAKVVPPPIGRESLLRRTDNL